MLTQNDLENLLQRNLTSNEVSNLTLYLDIATEALESLLCTPVSPAANKTRKFYVRYGYHSAYVDIIRTATSVKLDDTTISASEYDLRQWDTFNAAWYNVLIFDQELKHQVLSVTGDWGFTELPADLKLLLARLFDNVSHSNSSANGKIKSKRVEDFSISYRTNDDGSAITGSQIIDDEFASTIAKYSLCNIPNLQSLRSENDCESCR